jgi:hypothetical protein
MNADNKTLGDGYISTIKSKLHTLGDDLLCEDTDLLCKYIVLRFLKTSAITEGSSREVVVTELEEFVENIWPFLLAFVSVANSAPFSPQVSSLFKLKDDVGEA